MKDYSVYKFLFRSNSLKRLTNNRYLYALNTHLLLCTFLRVRECWQKNFYARLFAVNYYTENTLVTWLIKQLSTNYKWNQKILDSCCFIVVIKNFLCLGFLWNPHLHFVDGLRERIYKWLKTETGCKNEIVWSWSPDSFLSHVLYLQVLVREMDPTGLLTSLLFGRLKCTILQHCSHHRWLPFPFVYFTTISFLHSGSKWGDFNCW